MVFLNYWSGDTDRLNEILKNIGMTDKYKIEVSVVIRAPRDWFIDALAHSLLEALA